MLSLRDGPRILKQSLSKGLIFPLYTIVLSLSDGNVKRSGTDTGSLSFSLFHSAWAIHLRSLALRDVDKLVQ